MAQLCRAISSQLRHVSTIGKNLLSSNISSRCLHNMVNFGLLAAEIISLVWGTRANFNAFRVLAALLHCTLVVGVSQTAAFNRGRHLYSAGRPSGWALAHISSFVLFLLSSFFLGFPRLISAVADWMSVYNTSTLGVASVRIYNAGLKCIARGSLIIQDAKHRHLGTIAQLCPAVSSRLRHVSTIGKKTC